MKSIGKIIITLFLLSYILCREIDPDEPEMADYEIEHIELLRKNAENVLYF